MTSEYPLFYVSFLLFLLLLLWFDAGMRGLRSRCWVVGGVTWVTWVKLRESTEN